jgi:GTP cyclohydrolase II
LKTQFGVLNVKVAKCPSNNKEFLIVYNDLNVNERVNVRIHHQCQTSEVFYSIHCDCKMQLDFFMKMLYKEKNTMLIYANEEGRGLGLFNKIKAYKLTNDTGMDTYNAMNSIAGKSENRSFEIPGDILYQMNINKINL